MEYNSDNIFAKIIKKKLPSEIVYEDDKIIAIKDKFPAAPVHLLIMPKKEIANFQSMQEEDMAILQDVAKVAQKLAKEFNLSHYRLLTNNGSKAGQTIFHLHFHLLGGRDLGVMG